MKKIIFGLFAVLFLGVACQDNSEEYLFEDNPNVRVEKLKVKYREALSAPENGWIGFYSPNDKVGGFVFLMKFDKDGNVTLKTDFSQTGQEHTTTYRIDKKQKIELVFESYTFLHQIYETNKNDVDGEYIFNILDVKEDSIELESATDFGYNGAGVTKLILKKATAEHWDLSAVYKNLENITIAGDRDLMKFEDYSLKRIYVKDTQVSKVFKFIKGNEGTEINRYAEITTLDSEGNESTEQVPVFITHDGFSFVKPYKIDEIEVQNFVFDKANNIFVSNDGGKTTIVENTVVPIKENENAMSLIKKFNISFYYSDKFLEDYLEPFKKIVPKFTSLQLYNKYPYGKDFLNELDVFCATETDNKLKWSGIISDGIKTTVRKDVISLNSNGYWYGVFPKFFQTSPEVQKFYFFFADKDQEFFIEEYGNGFILFDRDKPEYFIVFKQP